MNQKMYRIREKIQHTDDDLDLSNLTSAKGLTLPRKIGGDLVLSGLRIPPEEVFKSLQD